MHRQIGFLTDFGRADEFVGICHGVIARIAPDARVIDITHGVPPQAVRRGASVLARSVPFLPIGITLAVVDPGVGGARHGVAIRTSDGATYVGPDNGLLTLAADTVGVTAARALTNARYHLEPVSRTFHARDIFAPVAAHVAAGVSFEHLGDELDPDALVRLALPQPRVAGGEIAAVVLGVDRFGNLELNIGREHLASARLAQRVQIAGGELVVGATVAEIYADVAPGGLLLHIDSFGAVALAANGASAAELTGLREGDVLTLTS